jgi:hypothetical protein
MTLEEDIYTSKNIIFKIPRQKFDTDVN